MRWESQVILLPIPISPNPDFKGGVRPVNSIGQSSVPNSSSGPGPVQPVRATLAPSGGPGQANPARPGGAPTLSQEDKSTVEKCKNFLMTLIQLAQRNDQANPETVQNVKGLVQQLIDDSISAESFTERLQTELQSSPQVIYQ